jgi:hypothetical protein
VTLVAADKEQKETDGSEDEADPKEGFDRRGRFWGLSRGSAECKEQEERCERAEEEAEV